MLGSHLIDHEGYHVGTPEMTSGGGLDELYFIQELFDKYFGSIPLVKKCIEV
jgi:hypothetical protein